MTSCADARALQAGVMASTSISTFHSGSRSDATTTIVAAGIAFPKTC